MYKLLLIFAVATVTKAVPLDNFDVLDDYPQVIEFPGEDDQMLKIDLREEPDNDLLEEIENDPSNNQYLLFTRNNPVFGQFLVNGDRNSIANSFFDRNKPIMVTVHGWLGSQNMDINPTIREAYLAKEDGNLIVLDWRRLATSTYSTAARGVPTVGRQLGQFLRFLSAVTGAPFATMHLVGFSMGAHVVGNAGRELGGQVTRVTGLDPAGPLFNVNSQRLNPNDGVYVEAIHTDGGIDGIGIGYAIADADFFPNGGRSQPGCLTLVCDHNRSWRFFAASITYNHLVGRKCATTLQLNLNRCRGEELRMGNSDLTKSGSGSYRLDTDSRYPY